MQGKLLQVPVIDPCLEKMNGLVNMVIFKDLNQVQICGTLGFLAIATPGELAGYWRAYKEWGSGKVNWSDLVSFFII